MSDQIKNLNQRVASLEKAVHKLESLNAPGKQNPAGISPQHAPHKENDSASGQPSPISQVNPATYYTGKTKQPWYKTGDGWKTALEIVAIPFAIGYAVVTLLSVARPAPQF